MNKIKLPTKLGKEPLIDVVFECRFLSERDLSVPHILPSLIASKREDKSAKIVKLSYSEIPENIRNEDLNLKYLPVVKVELEFYEYFIGDNSYGITCKLPYNGWLDFKTEIIHSLKILKDSKVAHLIESYHMKYVDFLTEPSIDEQFKTVNVTVQVGESKLYNAPYNLAIRLDKANCSNIIKVILGAVITSDSNEEHVSGVVIDIDTIKQVNGSFEDIYNDINDSLELMHNEGKKEFFNLLTERTIASLEPSYD